MSSQSEVCLLFQSPLVGVVAIDFSVGINHFHAAWRSPAGRPPCWLHGRSARIYGSKGQQRSLVLALKTAEIQLLNEKLGCAPIVLLDDVSSELDYQRNARFFEFLGGFKGQVFITTTDPNFLLINGNKSLWHVDDGRIVSEE